MWLPVVKDLFPWLQEDVNIIRVDWAPGAGLPYLRALTNTQVVGAEISLWDQPLSNEAVLISFDFFRFIYKSALCPKYVCLDFDSFILFLAAQRIVDYSNIHLIGHDLGAHVASYAGRRIYGIGRITGIYFSRFIHFSEQLTGNGRQVWIRPQSILRAVTLQHVWTPLTLCWLILFTLMRRFPHLGETMLVWVLNLVSVTYFFHFLNTFIYAIDERLFGFLKAMLIFLLITDKNNQGAKILSTI